ncbi:MAG: PEP-CTERM sorting domain-containing protein [Myxococcales bacterium]|nr:PEP-CTERM sorting domain-containing protein [Myxococcales bacterium]
MRERPGRKLRRSLCFGLGLTLAAAVVPTPPAEAGQITGVTWFSGVASVALAGWSTPDPNNDDFGVGASPNVVPILQKDYFAIGPVDIVLDVADSGGTTEYLIVEGVLNNTGVDWGGYHIELGFGTGAGFVASTAGDGLDFDAPDFTSDVSFNPSPGFFPSQVVTEDDILASGGIQPDFSFAGNFLFHVDVPDGISSFTIRQSPIAVPEPSTALFVALGLVGLAARRQS